MSGGLRPLWVIAHRWAGLSLAFFLVVVGGTGAILPFYHELERLTAPGFMTASTGPEIDLLELRARAEALSGGQVDFAPLHVRPGDSAIFYVSPRPGERPLPFDQIALDPVTGAELGRRMWGDLGDGVVNLMPFVYRLHYTLALDSWGAWILGIAALVWTFDCFVGWYLTLPVSRAGWWGRWRKAWAVRTSSRPKLEFDLHRASGLWLWPILLVFAWSSVGFNLRPVYAPVMDAVFGEARDYDLLAERAEPLDAPVIGWYGALERGRELAEALGAESGFTVERDMWLRLDRTHGAWVYGFRRDEELYDRFAGARLAFDADTGEFIFSRLSTGQNARNTADTWLYGIHMAAIGGLPVRIAVSVAGLAVMLLSATGILIWLRKRSARTIRRGRPSPPHRAAGAAQIQPAE